MADLVELARGTVPEALAAIGVNASGLSSTEAAERSVRFAQLRPQLLRAQAYAFAHADDLKSARRVLRRLGEQDPRLLGGFVNKKTHPLLQREAKKLLEQSGTLTRKMQIQRRS